MTRATDFAIAKVQLSREELLGTNIEPSYSGVLSYVRRKYTRELTHADVAVTGIPYDLACTNRPGARFGPRAIRAASTVPSPPYEHFNIETGVDPFGVFKVADYGDVNVSPGDVIESLRRMTDKVKSALDVDAMPIMLGGDHSITFANVRAFAKKHKNIGMIHIDTHADCAPQGLTGFKYDHGAHIRRIPAPPARISVAG